jgi:hypothetical protein
MCHSNSIFLEMMKFCRCTENVKVLRCKSTKCGNLVFIYTIVNGDDKWDFEERSNNERSFNFTVEKLEGRNNIT